MITQIGLIAGDIWNYLDNHEGVARIADIIKGIQKSPDVVLMSIGWLAREGYVVLEGESSAYIVKLTKRNG